MRFARALLEMQSERREAVVCFEGGSALIGLAVLGGIKDDVGALAWIAGAPRA